MHWPLPAPARFARTWHSHSGPSLLTGWTCLKLKLRKWQLQTPWENMERNKFWVIFIFKQLTFYLFFHLVQMLSDECLQYLMTFSLWPFSNTLSWWMIDIYNLILTLEFGNECLQPGMKKRTVIKLLWRTFCPPFWVIRQWAIFWFIHLFLSPFTSSFFASPHKTMCKWHL